MLDIELDVGLRRVNPRIPVCNLESRPLQMMTVEVSVSFYFFSLFGEREYAQIRVRFVVITPLIFFFFCIDKVIILFARETVIQLILLLSNNGYLLQRIFV